MAKAGVPRRLIGMSVVLFGVAFLGWGYFYIQGPAEGVVREPRVRPQTKAASSMPIIGKQFRLNLPGNYRVVSKDTSAVAPAVEQYSFTQAAATGSRRISIMIKSTPPAAMDEDSAYVFRKTNSQYVVSEEMVGGHELTRLSKKDGSEITFFLPDPAGYAIIAATSTSPSEAFVQEVNRVVKSFRWK